MRVCIENVFCTKHFYHVLSPPSIPPRSSLPAQLHVISLKSKEKKTPTPQNKQKNENVNKEEKLRNSDPLF